MPQKLDLDQHVLDSDAMKIALRRGDECNPRTYRRPCSRISGAEQRDRWDAEGRRKVGHGGIVADVERRAGENGGKGMKLSAPVRTAPGTDATAAAATSSAGPSISSHGAVGDSSRQSAANNAAGAFLRADPLPG